MNLKGPLIWSKMENVSVNEFTTFADTFKDIFL